MLKPSSRFFSYTETENLKIFRFLGVKFSCRNAKFSRQEKKIQDLYDLTHIKSAKTLVIFLLPDKRAVNGGIQSIYSICEYSRKILENSICVLSTVPSNYTYSYNPYFLNEEKIYRWEQIINNINADKVVIHIPEFFADKFYKHLRKTEINKLKNVKDLQINILNQNINFMPEPSKIQNLFKITKNVTQTIAHNAYATQDVCDKWCIPTHLLSVHIDLSKYSSYDFENKEKIIVLSPDDNEYREQIVQKLKDEMPDFKLITVQNMTFVEYMNLIAKSYFTITFGEGMDGYFLQPYGVGSIGIAVYNNLFFPNENWKNLKSVYSSYDDMVKNIAIDLKFFYSNPQIYYSTIREVIEECKKIYNFENWINNIKMFYNKTYDFIPNKNKEYK